MGAAGASQPPFLRTKKAGGSETRRLSLFGRKSETYAVQPKLRR